MKTFKTDLELYETRILTTISSEFNFFAFAGLIITGYHTQAEHFFRNYGLIHALNEWLEGKNIKFTRPVISNKPSFYGLTHKQSITPFSSPRYTRQVLLQSFYEQCGFTLF